MKEPLRRHPLGVFFRDLLWDVFPDRTGMADPEPLVYLESLLLRFAFVSELYRFRDLAGRRLEEVAELLSEAELRMGIVSLDHQRDLRRHIGDFTLFWTGVFPEALPRMQGRLRKDHLLEYVKEGRQAYYQVSLFDDEPFRREAPLFRKLSTHFELCASGLHAVREEWEQRSRSTFHKLSQSIS